MATIRQDISNVRNLIKQVQDDTDYTDQFLYSLLSIASSKLQEQHNKSTTLNTQDAYTFCIPLELAKSHDCDCVLIGCDVLKSVYEIPGTMSGKYGDLFKVETLGDTLISPKNPQVVKDDNLDDIKRGKLGWYLRSGKLIIWNDIKLKAVQVTGIWEDITEWQGKELCNEDGTTTNCDDVLDLSFPLDGHLMFDAYKMVLSMLRIPLALPEDHTVDNNQNIKA